MTTPRARSAGRPTLDQVAAHAGVGRGTVSRVVNGSPQVSPEAKAMVEKAIADLGYVPNRAARALVTQRTDSVALVVSESGDRLFGEPFFAGIVRGISTVLADTQLQLWLAMAQSPAERVRIEHHLTDQHVDGVLLLSLHGADPLPALLAERGLPTVFGARPVSGTGFYVDVDNVAGAREAVAHLVSTGRRKVATIAGPPDMSPGVDRLTGYRAAIGTQTPLIEYGDFSEASGIAAMRKLLAADPDIDAVFAASDVMAAGALRVLRETGRRVPQDVAVVGYEDSIIATQTDPPLTSVYQPVEEMGREMARMLIDLIRGEIPQRPILLDTHLVRRASS
ncbi:DNA-binding LacI/PurR family transcriptional regulator [Allocatelliglobosispora scoriae]|uniref:DNA-binding LacI/PurR family transcriptional regulator n=1 Tax=Allocatelliglobosispora scoriae TaxID=643052 RepID=A0A841BWG1_9ACTN|nr:LacI family DNA-binding transcriptional regulator [Allocatelliglobosispora scoriae]MBB5872494.1 DNA-binding LacI/PurR family transcriptional regulator [Allocatelliglobosispora scoriae]